MLRRQTCLRSANADLQLRALWCLSSTATAQTWQCTTVCASLTIVFADCAPPTPDLAAGASDLCLRALAAAPLLIQLLSSGNPVRCASSTTMLEASRLTTLETRCSFGCVCPIQLFEEQAAFTLGNMAADSPHCRDTVVANGALVPLARLLDTQAGVRRMGGRAGGTGGGTLTARHMNAMVQVRSRCSGRLR